MDWSVSSGSHSSRGAHGCRIPTEQTGGKGVDLIDGELHLFSVVEDARLLIVPGDSRGPDALLFRANRGSRGWGVRFNLCSGPPRRSP